uniref:Uncharacterized protein n=1 Tax=Siphoviridae sp. ctPsO101 TaxID=2825487 RepID=A0A8S5PXE7_9CAUD|nr:MAG TPA: hypothetical protein [Siphoviridae sp. ctPsO101]
MLCHCKLLLQQLGLILVDAQIQHQHAEFLYWSVRKRQFLQMFLNSHLAN